MAFIRTANDETLAFLAKEASAPMTETLMWVTDLLPHYDGTEQRVKLRSVPRQGFQQTIPCRHGQTQDVMNTVYGALLMKWFVPVWSESQYVGSISEGQTEIPVDTTVADLRVGSLVLLWGACGRWGTATVAAGAGGTLTIGPGAVALKTAHVVPLRIGIIPQTTNRKTNGSSSEWGIQYEVEDNIEITGSAPAQFLGEDIYYDEAYMDGDSIQESVDSSFERVDYDVGQSRSSTPWLNNRISRPFNIYADNLAEAWQLRVWLHRRAGRYKAFWQPSFGHDVRLAQTGTLGSVIQIKNDSRLQWASNRKHLAFQSNDGTWYPRTVTDIATTIDPDVLQLTLSSSVAVDASRIVRISDLGLRRLDTDTVNIRWTGAGQCNASMQTVELTP